MRHEEKLDYLLRVIHQYPEMSYSDIYKKLDKAMIWDEYIKLIKELIDHHCLAYDFYLGYASQRKAATNSSIHLLHKKQHSNKSIG